jgi:hypothetical protein
MTGKIRINKAWTPEEEERLATMVKNGRSKFGIAANLGRSMQAVAARATRLGLSLARRRPGEATTRPTAATSD